MEHQKQLQNDACTPLGLILIPKSCVLYFENLYIQTNVSIYLDNIKMRTFFAKDKFIYNY